MIYLLVYIMIAPVVSMSLGPESFAEFALMAAAWPVAVPAAAIVKAYEYFSR